jgi:hypothetical protein
MARHEDTCWRCGAAWEDHAQPPAPLLVVAGETSPEPTETPELVASGPS